MINSKLIGPGAQLFEMLSNIVKMRDYVKVKQVLLPFKPKNSYQDVNTKAATKLPSSTLNPNASPIQLSISLRKAITQYRLIADSGCYYALYFPSRTDWIQALKVLDRLSTSTMFYLIESAFKAFTLGDSHETMQPGIATGSSLPSGGISIYFQLSENDHREKWLTIYAWLSFIGLKEKLDPRINTSFEEIANVIAVGIEGNSLKQARIKFYWHLKFLVPLYELPIQMFSDTKISEFLDRALCQRKIGLHSLFFETGFSFETGKITDVKIDICGHCAQLNSREWMRILYQTAETIGTQKFPVKESILRNNNIGFACAGLGLNIKGDYRLNAYLYEKH